MGEYVNKGSDHLRGVTWEYRERFPYAGTIIPHDKAGKIAIMIEAGKTYREKNPTATPEECAEYGRYFLNRERKHQRAYAKAKNSYNYKKGTYLVEDESRLERFKRFAAELEQKSLEKELELDNNKEITLVGQDEQ